MRSPLLRMSIRKDTHHYSTPIENPSNTFGNFANRNSGLHQGWDLEAAVGTPIFAISNGEIVYVEKGNAGSYGRNIVLSFNYRGRKLYAFYAHLKDIASNIKVGTNVQEGNILGHTGKSGNAYNVPIGEEHLHFEIRTKPTIPKGYGLAFRLDPGEIFGYAIYSCHY